MKTASILIILLHRIFPDPIFIVFEEFWLDGFLADWTRYRFGLITRWHRNIESSQFSITLGNLHGSSSLGIQWSMFVCTAFAFHIKWDVVYPILWSEMRCTLTPTNQLWLWPWPMFQPASQSCLKCMLRSSCMSSLPMGLFAKWIPHCLHWTGNQSYKKCIISGRVPKDML